MKIKIGKESRVLSVHLIKSNNAEWVSQQTFTAPQTIMQNNLKNLSKTLPLSTKRKNLKDLLFSSKVIFRKANSMYYKIKPNTTLRETIKQIRRLNQTCIQMTNQLLCRQTLQETWILKYNSKKTITSEFRRNLPNFPKSKMVKMCKMK